MKRHWLVVIIWAAAIFQAYFISAATDSRFSINLLLVLLLYVVINRSLQLSLLLAAWGGMWLDLAAGQFGPRILIFVGLTLLMWWAQSAGLEMQRRIGRLSLIFGLSILYSLLLFLITSAILYQLNWRFSVLWWWGLEATLTTLFAWLLGRRLQSIVKIV